MEEQKRYYAETSSSSKAVKLLTKLDDLIFISANDFVSSAFFNVVYARLPMFTRNIRGRCPEFAEGMEVNSEAFLILYPLRYESLALI